MSEGDSQARPEAVKRPLFRARALEAIDSREGLDELMTIVPARQWIALVAILGVLAVALIWAAAGRVPIVERGVGVMSAGGGTTIVSASTDGFLIADPRPVGATVALGDVVGRVRTAALETSPLRAPTSGTIVDVRGKALARVKRGDPIVTIEPASATLRVTGFVTFQADRRVVPGTTARITPIDDSGVAVSPERGHVLVAAPEPATAERVAAVLGSGGAASALQGSSVREVTIALEGDARPIAAGTPCSIVLVVDNVSPLAFLFAHDR